LENLTSVQKKIDQIRHQVEERKKQVDFELID
jgi:hypothetical protein